MPGMAHIDRFYYSNENVDRSTISRFYGYTLEDTGAGALRQLDPYLEFGHMLSADRRIDYSARLGEVTTPTLMIAGDGDIMSDVRSTELTFDGTRKPRQDALALRQVQRPRRRLRSLRPCLEPPCAREIFPPLIDWLDQRQPGTGPSPPGLASPQTDAQLHSVRSNDSMQIATQP